MRTVLFWSTGNDKLTKTDTISFNLPAYKSLDGFQVCPQAGICRFVCYARQARYMFPDSIRAREINLDIVRTNLALFERLAILDLQRIKNESIRIHDSGDFFSQAYLESWFRIVRAYPDKAFYCYSKSLHLDWSGTPANLQDVQSVGGKLDHLIDRRKSHSRIFISQSARREAGYVDGTHTDRHAQKGTIKIGLVYHGNTDLTDKTRKMLVMAGASR